MAQAFLLVLPEVAAVRLSPVFQRELGATTEQTAHRRSLFESLHWGDYHLVLLDENLAAAEPDATQALYQRAGNIPVLELNSAICNPDRVLRQVRAVLARRAQDEAKARSAAITAFNNELSASLTGLLLESQLALRQAGPEVAPALQRLVHLAGELRNQLRVA